MPTPTTLEERLRDAALAYARRLVALARAQSIDAVAALDPRVAPTVEQPSTWLRWRGRLEPRALAQVDGSRRGWVPAPPDARTGAFVRTTTLTAAHALADVVADVPWPARARELCRLLGISKERVLRAARLALEMGLVVRAGTKKTAMYSVGPSYAGDPTKRRFSTRSPSHS